jgi:hypothetical protein
MKNKVLLSVVAVLLFVCLFSGALPNGRATASGTVSYEYMTIPAVGLRAYIQTLRLCTTEQANTPYTACYGRDGQYPILYREMAGIYADYPRVMLHHRTFPAELLRKGDLLYLYEHREFANALAGYTEDSAPALSLKIVGIREQVPLLAVLKFRGLIESLGFYMFYTCENAEGTHVRVFLLVED